MSDDPGGLIVHEPAAGSGLAMSEFRGELTNAGESAVTAPVDYSRRLYDDVLGWYHNADAKAQVVLGLDGAFLAFVTAAAFQKPVDLTSLITEFSPWTWRFLGLMAVTLAASMGSAIFCLWSRIYLRPSAVVDRIRAKSDTTGVNKYPPDVMWFFQLISVLDPTAFRQTLMGVNASFEVAVLASQIAVLSNNVRKKHIAANAGFVLAVVTLLLFAAAAASYVMAVTTAG